MNYSYLRSTPGCLKISILLTTMLCIICIMEAGPYKEFIENNGDTKADTEIIEGVDYVNVDWSDSHQGRWFIFISISGFIITSIILFLHVTQIKEKLAWFPLVELTYSVLWTMFFLITIITCWAHPADSPGMAMAPISGFVSMVAYGKDAYLQMNGDRQADTRVSLPDETL